MTNELETVAWVLEGDRHVQAPVVVSYELDGYRPIGLWVQDEHGSDITCLIEEAEYDITAGEYNILLTRDQVNPFDSGATFG